MGFAQPSQGLGTAPQGWQFGYTFAQPGVSLPLAQHHPTSNPLWMNPGLPFSLGQQAQPQQQVVSQASGLTLQHQPTQPAPPTAVQAAPAPAAQLDRSGSKGNNSSGSWSAPVNSALAAELRSSPPREDPQPPATIKEEPIDVKPPTPQPSLPRSTAESQPQPTPPRPQAPAKQVCTSPSSIGVTYIHHA